MKAHWIGGDSYLDKTEPTRTLHNPATGQPIEQIPLASAMTCQRAIEAAASAYSDWSQSSLSTRAQILLTFRQLLLANQARLCELVTLEQGKTLEDAKGSLLRGVELLEWYCGIPSHWQTPFTHHPATQLDCYTIRQSLGVCVGISPFNFPIMVPLWLMIPAIACGNTFILKPSEQDPSASLLLATLLHEAGLPKGVLNVVLGDKEVVNALITHPEVAAVAAVASTPVAQHIYTTATAAGKRVQTFGGAKNHAVVMPDADLAQAAKAIVGAAYGSAGQRCMAISAVVLVGESTAKTFLAHCMPLIQAIKIGAGTDPTVQMGPVISAAQQARILQVIDTGEKAGARLLIDGRTFEYPREGYFVGPTLFDQVTPNMQIYQEELFGPVLVCLTVERLEEAIDLINAGRYGNGTAIFTQSGVVADQFIQKIQVGMVGVNIPIPVPIVSHSFGGWKASAFGDTAMHGTEGIHFYTRLKTITARWQLESGVSKTFVMPTHTHTEDKA